MPFDNQELPANAKVLLRAAELVEQGHCKHRLVSIEGGKLTAVCLIGAICVALGEEQATPQFSAYDVMHFERPRIEDMLSGRWDALVEFNNAPSTTGAMVASTLRTMAAQHMETAHAV